MTNLLAVLKRYFVGAALSAIVVAAAAAEEPARTIHICRKTLVSWKRPPDLTGPQDVAQHLSKNRDTSVKWIYRYTVTMFITPFKGMGFLGGWTDYCSEVCATGAVVESVWGIDRFHTADLQLQSLQVNGENVLFEDPRFLRAEIHGKARKAKRQPRKGDLARICGRLMWDAHGWFEVHPRTPEDLSFPAVNPGNDSQQEKEPPASRS